MPTKVYSNNAEAKAKRIARLPKIYGNIMSGAIKGNMLGLIKEFRSGIKKNSFNLDPLKPETINNKRLQGFKRPDTPLYGKGEDRQKNSYINMLRLSKIKNGWKVWISRAQHWSVKIGLYDLFIIHEFGCTIQKGNNMIRIPRRPAYTLAYQSWMGKRAKNRRETSRKVKKAIIEFINDADEKQINWFINFVKKKDKSEE